MVCLAVNILEIHQFWRIWMHVDVMIAGYTRQLESKCFCAGHCFGEPDVFRT